MNAPENAQHAEQPEPLVMNELAQNHYWRMTNLRDLIKHLESYALDGIATEKEIGTVQAMLYAALELVCVAADEAEHLNICDSAFGYQLMAMPRGMAMADEPAPDDGWQRVRAALRIAADADATVEEMAQALGDVHALADQDESYASDLDTLTRLIELRGYAVGWLTMMGRSNPRVTPSQGMMKHSVQPSASPFDVRACLTAEEIETAARAFSGGLEAYLVAALSHPAEERQRVEEEAHEHA